MLPEKEEIIDVVLYIICFINIYHNDSSNLMY